MKRILIAIVLAAMPVTIFGANTTATLGVSATVQAAGECTVGGSGAPFGSVTPPLVTNLDLDAQVQVQCPSGTPYSISLSTGGSADFAQRKMALAGGGPTDTLTYNFYTDANRTTVWGDGTGSSVVVTGTGSGATQLHWAYGRIPPQATPPPGSYQDSITITVIY